MKKIKNDDTSALISNTVFACVITITIQIFSKNR